MEEAAQTYRRNPYETTLIQFSIHFFLFTFLFDENQSIAAGSRSAIWKENQSNESAGKKKTEEASEWWDNWRAAVVLCGSSYRSAKKCKRIENKNQQ